MEDVLLLYCIPLFFFLSLLFYDALIPKINFKVFKEKIFLKLMILSTWILFDNLSWYIALSLLCLIMQWLYNQKTHQSWKVFDFLCIWSILGSWLALVLVAYLSYSSIEPIASKLSFILPFVLYGYMLTCCGFFAFKFLQKIYSYIRKK